MLHLMLIVVLVLSCPVLLAKDHWWPLESADSSELSVHGKITEAPGVEGGSAVFDGASLVRVKDSERLTGENDGFTLTAWVNPYLLSGKQQMIAAKNCYSLGHRQWGVMIDEDNRFRLYVWQGKWAMAAAMSAPRPGHWHLLGVVLRPQSAELWVNGKLEGQVKLTKPIPQTQAPLTFGGIDDNGRIRQNLVGALDEIRLFDQPLNVEQMAASYKPVTATHKIPRQIPPFKLWGQGEVPGSQEAPLADGVKFRVIKPYEFATDGYRFLHGVALAWHKQKLYASFGHNQGGENTDTEEARYRVSKDGGNSWSEIRHIDVGEPGLGVSHGAFLSHKDQLWAFHGAYSGIMKNVHTRAYTLNETTGLWQLRGTVVEDGFWVMNQPVKMDDGNWIMPGARIGGTNPAAVAISQGDDLTKWNLVIIPCAPAIGQMWGESSIIVDGPRVVNIARYGREAKALASVSVDFGQTWTPMTTSNLPMVTSKPCAGILSTGQRFLIATTTANTGKRRAPLTIAVSKPDENVFSKVFIIRHAEFPDGPGESHPNASLAYPYAVEHDGKLFVGYSNNGGNVGRTGKGRELWNNNSAELAVIPVESLKVE